MMRGSIALVGLGPGPAEWMTAEAQAVLQAATDLVGYAAYLARLPARAGQQRHASDNRAELDRARHALRLARDGRHVAVVSGGDPGVFGMAAAVLEVIESEAEEGPSDVDFRIVPGVSAMLAAAARLGAPLGSDFCAISLSDNLKPWDLIVRRLNAALDGDFVIALYNPASRSRPRQIHEAFAIMRARRPPATPVAFARAVGRPDEQIIITTLAEAEPERADMSTLLLVGSSRTRFVSQGAGRLWLLTPRHHEAER